MLRIAKNTGLITLVIILAVTAETGYCQCSTTVILMTPGPPSWTYTYYGTGVGGVMTGFELHTGCPGLTASAPPPFDYTIIPGYGVIFYSMDLQPCSSYFTDFVVSITTAINGVIEWEDPLNTTAGMVGGPWCPFTPTPTVTATGSVAASPTPSPTPTPTDTPAVPSDQEIPGIMLIVCISIGLVIPVLKR